MKKKKKEEDEVPQERAERTEKITREVRGEPEFDEYDEDYEDEDQYEEQPKRGRGRPPRRAPPRSRAVGDSLDLAAHTFLVNSFARQFQGWPQHLADAEMHRVCGAHLKRIKELHESLQEH